MIHIMNIDLDLSIDNYHYVSIWMIACVFTLDYAYESDSKMVAENIKWGTRTSESFVYKTIEASRWLAPSLYNLVQGKAHDYEKLCK